MDYSNNWNSVICCKEMTMCHSKFNKLPSVSVSYMNKYVHYYGNLFIYIHSWYQSLEPMSQH